MQAPTRVTTKEAYELTGRVLVNGTDIGANVLKVDGSRDIPDGLPGSSGFRSASWTVTADMSDATSWNTPTPWTRQDNWPPRPSDRVEVWLSDDGGATEWQQIVGLVEDPSGATDSSVITFTVVDRYQEMHRPLRIPALSNAMPSLTDTNSWRYIGMQPSYLADCALRAAGRYSTPSMMGNCFVSVPMMGSTWPERGELTYSVRRQADTQVAFPSWVTTPYGRAAQNVELQINPWSWSGLNLNFNKPMELTQELPDTDGSTYIRVIFGNGSRIEVACSASTAFVRYYPSVGGGTRDIVSRFRSGRERLHVRLTRSGNRITASIRLTNREGRDDPATETASITINDGDYAGPVTNVWAYSEGTLGAFQIGYPVDPWSRLRWSPNARMYLTNIANTLTGVPEQIDVDAIDFLDQVAEAELASWWIDENDVLQYWERSRLVARSNAATLTAADHIKKLPWKHTGAAQAAAVHVDYKTAQKIQRWRTNLTLFQGSNQTLEQGDDEEMFVNVPNDEIWLGVDYQNWTRYAASDSTDNMWAINRGIRSVLGGFAVDSDGNERRTNSIIPAMRRITDDTYAVRHRITNLGNDETASTQLPTEVATQRGLWARWRGQNLPLIRGKGKVTFEDARYTSGTRGPSTSPDHTHNVGWLIQLDSVAERLGDYLAAYTSTYQYEISGVDIAPVLNLQVGDVITLDDPLVTGTRVRGLVTSNSISADLGQGECDQSVSLRVLEVTTGGPEWRDFGQAHSARQNTWGDFGSSRTGETWADFGADPLKGT